MARDIHKTMRWDKDLLKWLNSEANRKDETFPDIVHIACEQYKKRQQRRKVKTSTSQS